MVIKITNDSLLEKIIQRQRENQLSDYKFAKKLNLSRSTWINTRLGTVPLGMTVLKAIVRTYPELCIDVLNFLRNEDHDSKN